MTVDGCKLPITLHVVSNKILTKHGLLLGTDFLDQSDKPVVRRPRRLAPSEKKEVDELMELWTNEGTIKPSNSEYASPIVVVRKKDGSIRVCVDFRELNELIECPHFPLPLIDDILDALQGKGIVIVYMDDIIILAKNLEEAWGRLQMVIELAEQYGLIINWGKCRFLQQEIEYLGYIVSKDTIRPSTHKTRAVANFPKPTSVKKVQSFLGLTGYFRKFIRGYAKIAKPLTDLLKKEVKFQFGDREVEAFGILKTALVNEPVLKLYRMGAETELHTDASAEGYGAILMQLDLDDGKFHPVYFASGKTTPAEAKYTSYELEVLAIVKALNKFRIYLLECKDDVLIVVPKAMQVQVVRQAHERGHFGVTKTEAIVKKDFWFKGLREKVEHVVSNCLDCILAERKLGKQEGYLNPLDKGDTPLDTYHIDHVGPMTATKKRYAHIFVVVDAFTKFTWLYPTRSTDTADVIDRLKKQAAVFGNPRRIISDRGTAFTSNAFQEYCEEENIKHLLVTTGAPRGNGQVERVNRTLIPLLTKLTAPKPDDWYKHVDQVQKYLNFTLNRSTGKTPFQLLVGVEMQTKEDPQIRKLVEEEWVVEFEEQRRELREDAKKKIAATQEENRRHYNKRRKGAKQYLSGELVAIKRTQFGPGLKLGGRFLGDTLEATEVLEHRIITTDNIPINTKQYRYPPIHREEINRQVQELLDTDVVEPSISPYNSPLWIVPKNPIRKEISAGD
ncbi:uncharacterized protein K02A2.6-like [Bombus bifarius]|uniref:RNA-directed DNA polymerase n=1 Tax=Bombus bifarius TaxID=103933 RepID=A0A6P8NVR8_9HYME|nr:uncharacterized protein K02A2.6-like [Bombus bifarius]